MLDPSQDPNWWIRFGGYALFAGTGGILGHILRTIDKDAKISWPKAIAEGVCAGFVGLLVLMACMAMQMDVHWTGLIVGVSGWLGARTTILALEKLVWGKLGIKPTGTNEDAN